MNDAETGTDATRRPRHRDTICRSDGERFHDLGSLKYIPTLIAA